eukprot:g4260.t1
MLLMTLFTFTIGLVLINVVRYRGGKFRDDSSPSSTGVQADRAVLLSRISALQKEQDSAVFYPASKKGKRKKKPSASNVPIPNTRKTTFPNDSFLPATPDMPPFPSIAVAKSLTHSALWKELKSVWHQLDWLKEQARRENPREFQNAYVFEEQARQFAAIAETSGVRHVCEIGFNCGHSAAIWQLFAGSKYPNEFRLTSFDVFSQRYASRCVEHFKSLHENVWGQRTRFIRGDSTLTLPQLSLDHPNEVCDVAVVDGLHFGRNPKVDLMNSLAMTPPGGIIIMDDTRCTSFWCKDPTAAWNWAIEQKKIQEVSCHEFTDTKGESVIEKQKGSRGWCVGKVIEPCQRCPPHVDRDEVSCECNVQMEGKYLYPVRTNNDGPVAESYLTHSLWSDVNKD